MQAIANDALGWTQAKVPYSLGTGQVFDSVTLSNSGNTNSKRRQLRSANSRRSAA